MVSVSTFLLVSRDGKKSQDITEDFLKDRDVASLAKDMFQEDMDVTRSVDGFEVNAFMYEVEPGFISKLFSLGLCEGLIFLGSIEAPSLMIGDLLATIEDDVIIKATDNESGEDITEYLMNHLNHVHYITSLTFENKCIHCNVTLDSIENTNDSEVLN